MKKPYALILAALAVPPLAYAGLAMAVGRDQVWETLFGRPAVDPVDFATLVPPDDPTHHLVCPPGLCRGGAAASPVFAAPAPVQRAAWMRLLERSGARWLDRGSPERADGTLEAEVRTPWLRFPDVVTIRPVPLEGGRSTVAVYSRSLYGRGDFGTNRRRVDGWLATLADELGRAP
ncbi:DUF1499 domain-containing protein [Azospirillum sp. ST 5-10]|uniref:DUF1499 domain-containing protein n=1 Tax=unclassified Azospirillum TaxID=2630922 RepID=UPI003F4A2597